MSRHSWRVLLIGGSSGVGKTVTARALSRRLQLSVLMVDDIRTALHAATTPLQHPDLHRFLTYDNDDWLNVQRMVRDWHTLAQTLIQPLRQIIAHHVVVEGAGRIIVEGDGISPALLEGWQLDNPQDGSQIDLSVSVRALFLVETDSAALADNLMSRKRKGGDYDLAHHRAYVEASRRFGLQLGDRARSMSLLVIAPRPRHNLLDRLLQDLE